VTPFPAGDGPRHAILSLPLDHPHIKHADVSTTEIYARADAEAKRRAIENAYEPLTPDALPDWTSDSSLLGWLDSLGR